MKKRYYSYPVIWIDFATGPGDELFHVVTIHAIVMDRKSRRWKVKRARAGSAEKGYGLPLGRDQRRWLAGRRGPGSVRYAGHMFDVESLTLVGRRVGFNKIYTHQCNALYPAGPTCELGTL